MNKWQRDVREFMKRVAAQPTPDAPTLDGYPVRLRNDLISEEAFEFQIACGLEDDYVLGGHIEPAYPPDQVAMVDAIVDLLYVTIGAAVAMGVDLDPFWDAVHASNMKKGEGPMRADGKRLKPPDWAPPDIAGILEQQKAAPRMRTVDLEDTDDTGIYERQPDGTYLRIGGRGE